MLPENAGAVKKNVGKQRVVWPQGLFHQVEAAGKALQGMGPFHAALLSQLHRTLNLHHQSNAYPLSHEAMRISTLVLSIV